MATLIKLRHPPCKHLLKKAIALTRMNCVITLAAQQTKRAQLRMVDEAIAKTRRLLEQYREQRAHVERESRVRGEVRAERQVIVAVLVDVREFFAGLLDEVQAMEKLARRVAANIANRADVAEGVFVNSIASSLEQLVRIKINAPLAHHHELHHQIELLTPKLGTGIELAIATDTDDAAQFIVMVGESAATFACRAQSLVPSLKNANNRLALM